MSTVWFHVCFLFLHLVSLELLRQDVKQIQKGFSIATSELVHDKDNVRLKVILEFSGSFTKVKNVFNFFWNVHTLGLLSSTWLTQFQPCIMTYFKIEKKC